MSATLSPFQHCMWLPAIANAILIFTFTLIVIPSGYFYARHCGIYSVDGDNKFIWTKIWIVFSQYIVQYMLVILWSYYSFRIDVNYVGRNHPWLFIYCLVYVCYSVTTTIVFALYCHSSKQLYSTWLFVSLLLLLFPSTAILIALFVSEEEHKVAAFDAGLSQLFIQFCFSIDLGSALISCFVGMLLMHHFYVLSQTWCNRKYLQYEPDYYSSQTAPLNRHMHSDSSSESSEIDYNYREKYDSAGQTIAIHASDIELQ